MGGLAFRVGPAFGGLSWEEGRVVTSANDALRQPGHDSSAPARAEAKEWLRELLKDGPVPASEVWERVKADGLCEKTVKAAKKELGVETKKSGGAGAGWVWYLSR